MTGDDKIMADAARRLDAEKLAGELPACNDTAVSPAEMSRLVSMRVGDRIMYRGQLCEVMSQRQDGTYVVTPVLQAAMLQAAQRRPRNRKERRAAAARERRA